MREAETNCQTQSEKAYDMSAGIHVRLPQITGKDVLDKRSLSQSSKLASMRKRRDDLPRALPNSPGSIQRPFAAGDGADEFSLNSSPKVLWTPAAANRFVHEKGVRDLMLDWTSDLVLFQPKEVWLGG